MPLNTPPYQANPLIPQMQMAGMYEGFPIMVDTDDASVSRTLSGKHFLPAFQKNVLPGRNSLALDATKEGVDIFVWFGRPTDGGLMHYFLAGAKYDSPAVWKLKAEIERGFEDDIKRYEQRMK